MKYFSLNSDRRKTAEATKLLTVHHFAIAWLFKTKPLGSAAMFFF